VTILVLEIVIYLAVSTFFFSLLGNLFFKKHWREFFVVFFIDSALYALGVWKIGDLGFSGFIPMLFLGVYLVFCFVGFGWQSVSDGL
jgi:hypothetical protein